MKEFTPKFLSSDMVNSLTLNDLGNLELVTQKLGEVVREYAPSGPHIK